MGTKEAHLDSRVLLVDAVDDHRHAVTEAIEDFGATVVGAVASIDEALDLLETQPCDVALVDVEALGDSGGEMARKLRMKGGRALSVIAMASGTASARVAEMVAAGARAYVVKDHTADILAAVNAVANGGAFLSETVTRPVLDEVARLYERERVRNDELQELVRQLQALSVTDWLTGLKNHGYFFERLDEELDRALRHRRPMTVVLGDLDDFKQINDTRGHVAGDRVLQAVGQAMLEELRTADVVCRIGGEEFGIILPETDGQGAFLVAERIRERVAAEPVPGVGKITISFGIASVPEHCIDRDDAMESADRALYLAKREGKNRTRVAGELVTMNAPVVARPLRGEIISLLVRVLRLRDPDLADHAVRCAELAVALGAHVQLGVTDLEHLRVASLLQDVGKIGVPDRILYKQGKLTEDEWQQIREHPTKGFDLVGTLVHPNIAEAVLANHERYDGTGYPRGLAGEGIPLLARILLVADAFTAMTRERPYSDPLSPQDALDELRRHAGTQFDPNVVEAMGELTVTFELPSRGHVGDFSGQAV